MKFAWCGFLHKWNEHWPAWLHIDNEITFRYRSLCRYCQRKLGMMSGLFYKLTILVLTLTLIFPYCLERGSGKILLIPFLTLPQEFCFNNWLEKKKKGKRGHGKKKHVVRACIYEISTGEILSPVSKNNYLLRNRTRIAGILFWVFTTSLL